MKKYNIIIGVIIIYLLNNFLSPFLTYVIAFDPYNDFETITREISFFGFICIYLLILILFEVKKKE